MNQTTASALYKHYLDLRKMRQVRVKQLQDQQKRVQQLEHHSFKIKNHIAKLSTEFSRVEETFDQMVEGNIWVTAKDYDQIHNTRYYYSNELDTYNVMLNEKHSAIEEEASSAKNHASHIIGIERALTCLEDQMRQEVEQPIITAKKTKSGNKKVNPLLQVQQQKVEQPIFFRRSKSQYSFTSIITANSTNSTSLSGTLLKKWLAPRVKQQQQHIPV